MERTGVGGFDLESQSDPKIVGVLDRIISYYSVQPLIAIALPCRQMGTAARRMT